MIFPEISILIFIFLNFSPSGMKTMDRKTGKRVRQVVLLNRRESPQERKHFLDNLSRNSKFQNLLGRLYPSNQELGARELMGLILAARTALDYCAMFHPRQKTHCILEPCPLSGCVSRTKNTWHQDSADWSRPCMRSQIQVRKSRTVSMPLKSLTRMDSKHK